MTLQQNETFFMIDTYYIQKNDRSARALSFLAANVAALSSLDQGTPATLEQLELLPAVQQEVERWLPELTQHQHRIANRASVLPQETLDETTPEQRVVRVDYTQDVDHVEYVVVGVPTFTTEFEAMVEYSIALDHVFGALFVDDLL